MFDLISQRLDGALLVYPPGLQTGGFKDPIALGQGWGTLNITVGTWCANNRLPPQIVAMDSGGNLYLYKNAGLAYIRAQAAIGTGFPAIRLSMVDYNADGFQDLLTTEPMEPSGCTAAAGWAHPSRNPVRLWALNGPTTRA